MCRFGMFIKIVFVFNHYRKICECRNYLLFLTLGKSGSFLEKASMMILTKEATDKDRSLKTQLLLSSNNSDEKLSGEPVWKSFGYFPDTRPELNLEKKNIPEKSLFYINQSYLSTVKNGDIAMYHDNFTLGQIIVAANEPTNIDNYSCKANEVKLNTCIYNLTTGDFEGLKTELAFIMLRGDNNQTFFSYGFDPDKSAVLYSTSKQKIPDTFISTAFRKHYSEIIHERRKKDEFSTLLHYLPSITDRKETINLHKSNVNLTPVDCPLTFIESFSTKKGTSFNPQLLNSTNPDHRNLQVEMLYGLFRQIAEYSHNNLVRNADYLLGKNKRGAENISWVGANKKRFDSTMFKLIDRLYFRL